MLSLPRVTGERSLLSKRAVKTRVLRGVIDLTDRAPPGRRADGGYELSLRAATPSAVHFVRARPFAAVISGDNLAGEILTTGVSQFLNLYNVALIGRLVLTWWAACPLPPLRPAGAPRAPQPVRTSRRNGQQPGRVQVPPCCAHGLDGRTACLASRSRSMHRHT